MRPRSPAIFAYHYLDLVARAYADRAGEPAPPAVRCVYVTLFKPRIGVKVQAWFWRHNPRKVPELRIGINFDASAARVNALAGPAFAERYAAELHALGGEFWPSETNTDRRYMTPVPVPPVGEDLTEVTNRAAELAQRYVELLKKEMQEPSSQYPASSSQ
jgi:hypothetical protein